MELKVTDSNQAFSLIMEVLSAYDPVTENMTSDQVHNLSKEDTRVSEVIWCIKEEFKDVLKHLEGIVKNTSH